MQQLGYADSHVDVKRPQYKELPFTFGSDYSGDTVTRSNYLSLKKEFDKSPAFFDVYGDYGTYGIAYDPFALSPDDMEKLSEVLLALESYPVWDEDAMTELENDFLHEAIADNISHNLTDYADLSTTEQNDLVDEVMNVCIDGAAEFETGCSVFIDWEKVREALYAGNNQPE